MTLRIESFTFDARDPMALATWWSEAIGWVICYESPDGVEVNLCERLEDDGGHPFPELSFVGDGNHDLYYMLAWESLAEREQKWGTFTADPEWNEKRRESEADGAIVANITSSFLTPTRFSTVK